MKEIIEVGSIVAALIPSYDRAEFGSWKDHNCLNTRNRVLIQRSMIPVKLDQAGCTVIKGRWLDEYNYIVIIDPKKVHVDHRISLKEAWYSGAWKLSEEKKHEFANDMDNLALTLANTNMSKGSKDPSLFLPRKDKCDYITKWVQTKNKWGLQYDTDELKVLDSESLKCE